MAKFVVLLPVSGYWTLALVLVMAPQGAQMLILTIVGPPLAVGAFVILLPERQQQAHLGEAQGRARQQRQPRQ